MELTTYLQFITALAFVLGLIATLTWLVKRSGLAGQILPNAGKSKDDRRLSVTEVLSLDSRRKLVLLRCDDMEHLLLMNQGQGPDLLIDKMAAAARTYSGDRLADDQPKTTGPRQIISRMRKAPRAPLEASSPAVAKNRAQQA
jgi:flagellar protein FliO/FliZ|tara:strand:+ start:1039 stop:1467 length:429 start_codon:yes stop_codon:yes gene_type:complete